MNWKLRGRVFGLVLLSVNFVSANAGYSVGPVKVSLTEPTPASQFLRTEAALWIPTASHGGNDEAI